MIEGKHDKNVLKFNRETRLFGCFSLKIEHKKTRLKAGSNLKNFKA